MARILVVDDENNIRTSLKNALTRRQHEVVTAENIKKAEEYLPAGFEVILLDVMLPDGNGLELLGRILKKEPDQTVVMISGQADINTAVDAIKLGAYDFIEKPLSLDRVLITIENATRTNRLKNRYEQLSSRLYGDFIGETDIIKKLKSDTIKSAGKTTRFLILGENGTGKELIAHLIHANSGFRNGSFVAVNCAALPGELVEAELFGHTAGAFTGATRARQGFFREANEGSIFLDEIGDMPLTAQAKILRVVETRTVTPVGAETTTSFEGNIIAASNRDLEKMAAESEFREDLLYRLNVVTFRLPPLRERRGDIPLLAEYFLNKFAAETKTPTKALSADARNYLMSLPYPGNVRELKNLMERVNIYCDKTEITREDLTLAAPSLSIPASGTLKDAVATFEHDYIKAAIARNDNNITAAARELGLERSHLYKKLRKYENN